MERTVIATDNAPAAIGPYSQAIKANGFIFTSGQIPLVPGTAELAATDVAGQTEQVMNNLKAVLEAAGSDFSRVVKTTIFLKDLSHFGQVNEIYAKRFPAIPPARSCVEVSRLPKEVLVEIEMVALA